MRLYGIIQAFRRGRMPDNHQIDHTFSYILSNPPVDVNKLSPEGRKLVDDVRQLLEVVSCSFPRSLLSLISCFSSPASKSTTKMPMRPSKSSSGTPRMNASG